MDPSNRFLTGYDHRPAPPSPANVQARTALLETFRRGVPGYPTDNRQLQSEKFGGYVYLAIMPLMRSVRAADVRALVRKPNNGRKTFGPGSVVAKSTSASYGASAREDFRPLDGDHPVCRIIDRPQGKDGPETIGDVLEYASLQGRLTGARILWGPPSDQYLSRGDWRPVQVYALPTALCVPQTMGGSAEYPNGMYRIMPYYATPTGSAGWFPGRSGGIAGTTLDGREIYRSLYKHPLVRWDGWSPQTACRFALDVAEAVDESRWAAMQHGTTPDMIVLANGMEAPTITALEEQLRQRHGGSKNARKVMVMSTASPEGKIDVKTPFISGRDMDYVGSWDQVVATVLAAFGTPKTVAMLGESEAYATWYAARRQFQDATVVPECRELSDLLTRTLGEPWADEPGQIRVEVIPQPVENEESERDTLGHELDAGVITVNEYRQKRNMKPVPGGDVPLSVWLKQVDAKVNPPEPVPPDLAGKPGKDGAPPPNKGKGPTAGAPPQPENDEAEGTRPPTGKQAKSMSSLVDSAGGALVAPATVGVGRKLGRRKSRRVVQRLLGGK